jgi:hypothetical protein
MSPVSLEFQLLHRYLRTVTISTFSVLKTLVEKFGSNYWTLVNKAAIYGVTFAKMDASCKCHFSGRDGDEALITMFTSS